MGGANRDFSWFLALGAKFTQQNRRFSLFECFWWQIHNRIKKYTCAQYNKSLTENSHLKRHSLSHNGEKPHKCTQCNYSATVADSLRKHILRHTGEKPHHICRTQETRLPAGCSWSAEKLVHCHFLKIVFFFFLYFLNISEIMFLKSSTNSLLHVWGSKKHLAPRRTCQAWPILTDSKQAALETMHRKPPCDNIHYCFCQFFFSHFHLGLMHLKQGLVTISLKSFEFELPGH